MCVCVVFTHYLLCTKEELSCVSMKYAISLTRKLHQPIQQWCINKWKTSSAHPAVIGVYYISDWGSPSVHPVVMGICYISESQRRQESVVPDLTHNEPFPDYCSYDYHRRCFQTCIFNSKTISKFGWWSGKYFLVLVKIIGLHSHSLLVNDKVRWKFWL